MEIVYQRWKILDAMESNPKGNDNFATKVISTEIVGKNVKRKSQTYFFSKSLTWETSLKLPSRRNY